MAEGAFLADEWELFMRRIERHLSTYLCGLFVVFSKGNSPLSRQRAANNLHFFIK